jgi:hypothetical protein
MLESSRFTTRGGARALVFDRATEEVPGPARQDAAPLAHRMCAATAVPAIVLAGRNEDVCHVPAESMIES